MNSICECLQIAFTELQEVHCICCLEYSWALQIPGKVPENSILIRNLKIHLRISKLLDKPTLQNWAMMLPEEGWRHRIDSLKFHFTEAQGQWQCFLPSSCIHRSAQKCSQTIDLLKYQKNKTTWHYHVARNLCLTGFGLHYGLSQSHSYNSCSDTPRGIAFSLPDEAHALPVPAAHKLLVSTLLFPSKSLLLLR